MRLELKNWLSSLKADIRKLAGLRIVDGIGALIFLKIISLLLLPIIIKKLFVLFANLYLFFSVFVFVFGFSFFGGFY